MNFTVGQLIVHPARPEWGPGKVLKVIGNKVEVAFRDLPASEIKKLCTDIAGLQIASEQSDPILDQRWLMEMVLLEKIAVAIWKQRRIVAAETGAITLRRQTEKVLSKVNSTLNFSSYNNKTITEEGIQPYDKDHEKWCKTVLAEYTALIEDDSEEFTFELVDGGSPEGGRDGGGCWHILCGAPYLVQLAFDSSH